MKVEQKLSDFSVEKQKRNENVKIEIEICGTKTKRIFFGGSGNRNGTVFSGGIDAEMKVFVFG
jgi:hypothetical protein